MLQLLKRVLADEYKIHDVRGVPSLVEVEKTFPDAILVQTLQITAHEAMENGFLVSDILE